MTIPESIFLMKELFLVHLHKMRNTWYKLGGLGFKSQVEGIRMDNPLVGRNGREFVCFMLSMSFSESFFFVAVTTFWAWVSI